VLSTPGAEAQYIQVRNMLAIRRLAVLVLIAALAPAQVALADSARVTFVLTNDIYAMGDRLMPDGGRRGGFARLAAVVKAERAKAAASGGHVIFAHGGDTLSPSLMSSLDRGAHIITLTNLVPPDIFAPGNHEFDFGKATFLQRMGEAAFPIYAANLRGPDGQPLAGFKDRSIVTIGGVRIGLTGATYDDSARASSPEDLRFASTVATVKQQAEAMRREGADFVVAVAHVTRREGYEIFNSELVDLTLTGHTHDLFINFDGRAAMVESSHDAHYVTAIDVVIEVKEMGGSRTTTWWPTFRVIDTATVTPDPEVAAVVAGFERELGRQLDVPIGTTAVELDSRTATVRMREAAIGNLIADAMRDSADADAAVMNGGGIRGGRIYAPGSTLTRRDILAELPFDNRLVTIAIGGGELRRALENGLSRLPYSSGGFPQVSGLTIEADASRPPGSRIVSIKVGATPLDESRTYRVATNEYLARGGDGYPFEDAKPLLPPEDSPLLVTEVIDYIKRLGTVRSGVEGRIVLK
jgi:2',3'-cyclic-nucleotide 2'-phosphodiesterase (5'-nucleotidase family)